MDFEYRKNRKPDLNLTNSTRTMVYDIFGQDVADYTGSSGSSLERENIYRGGQLVATQEFNRVNFALAANGGVASASSELSGSFPASGTNNGDRKGLNWESDGGWRDAEPGNSFPDSLEIDFNGNKTIDEIDVFTVQDSYASPSEPTEAMSFSLYGLSGYDKTKTVRPPILQFRNRCKHSYTPSETVCRLFVVDALGNPRGAVGSRAARNEFSSGGKERVLPNRENEWHQGHSERSLW